MQQKLTREVLSEVLQQRALIARLRELSQATKLFVDAATKDLPQES